MLDARHIRRRFENAAHSFDDADFVHAATRQGLLERLQPLLVDAKNVLDLGSATGATVPLLQQQFKKSNVIAIDIAHAMLQKARGKKKWRSRSLFAQASADRLPFASESIDVVFSNLLLPWLPDPGATFAEIARILRKGGVFAFATLGPDSLLELSRAWGTVDADAHVNLFPDMHNLGDGLVQAGLSDPVLDVDRLTVTYGDSKRLFADLTAVGARNALSKRPAGLTGKSRFAAMVAALQHSGVDDQIRLDLELVFGHCWGAGPKTDAADYRISADRIPLRRS